MAYLLNLSGVLSSTSAHLDMTHQNVLQDLFVSNAVIIYLLMHILTAVTKQTSHGSVNWFTSAVMPGIEVHPVFTL